VPGLGFVEAGSAFGLAGDDGGQVAVEVGVVPPWIVGAKDGGSLTYANSENQALHFVTYSLRPWLVAIEQAFSADRDLFMERTSCEFLLDAVIRADSATRAQVYTAALNPETGWMTRAEVRRLENLEPASETI